jgi:predicted HTH domain antitoxin
MSNTGTWKLDHFAKLYSERKIALARAAREADVSLWEMVDHTARHKVAAQYDLEDLRHDLETISRRRR